MAIKWLCTGRSEHDYVRNVVDDNTGETFAMNGAVIAIDFKAEIDTESEAGAVNELFDTKPVLTEAGVEAFVGLQVYPQGFTVYGDTALTNISARGVIKIGTSTFDASDILQTQVGDNLKAHYSNSAS